MQDKGHKDQFQLIMLRILLEALKDNFFLRDILNSSFVWGFLPILAGDS